MKRFLFFLLPVFLLTVSAGCGSQIPSIEKEDAPPPPTAPVLVRKDCTQVRLSCSRDVMFDGQVLLDQDEYCFKITKIEPSHMWGYTLTAQMENRSQDKDYVFSLEGASINGMQIDPVFSVKVPPGTQTEEAIIFNCDLLFQHGISDVTDIQLKVQVQEAGDWMSEAIENVTTHIYPYGEEHASTFDRQPEPSDQVLVDTKDLRIVVIGYQKDHPWGYGTELFLVNKTNRSIQITAENTLVNGIMIDPAYKEKLLPNTCAFHTMTWPRGTLDQHEIQEVREIDFTLRVVEADKPDAKELLKENVMLRP